MNLRDWIIAGAGIAVLVWFPAAFAYAATRTGRAGGAKDRRALVSAAATAVLGLVIGRAYAPWDMIPAVLWSIPAAVTVWGLLAAAWNWPALPWVAAGRPALRLAGTAASLAVTGLLIALLA